MEIEEQIYINIEELGDFRTKHQGPEDSAAENEPVTAEAVAGEGTETVSRFKVAAVCLGLLCFLLLTTAAGVGVRYDRDFKQLTRDVANSTAEKDELLARYQNLTDERDQLQSSLESAILELNNVKKYLGACPDGWRLYGCSCYFLSTKRKSWDSSTQSCINQGAHLVNIDSQGEMVFLNKLGAPTFWIGLSRSSTQRLWVWTDGRSLGTSYWLYGHPSFYYYTKTKSCAAFNNFNSGVSLWGIQSWSSESCTLQYQSVCEKQADMSHVSL